MQLKSLVDCNRYVEAELDRTVRRLPGWVATATDVLEWHGPGPMRSRSSGVQAWRVAPADGRGWYRLDAALHEQEFIIWFGHRQAGIERSVNLLRFVSKTLDKIPGSPSGAGYFILP